MDKSNTLVIYNSVEYFVDFFNQKGIKTFTFYKRVNYFSQVIRKILYKIGFSRYYWFEDWKNELKTGRYKNVILFANDEVDVWNYINKYNVNVIFWYWNPSKIYKRGLPNLLPSNFHPYSFDPNDCENYSISFNTTFYFDNIKLPKTTSFFDILFVGLDKGRGKKLKDFQINIKHFDLNSHIYIVGDRNKLGKYDGNQPISYPEYLKLISGTKAILDLIQENQSGLTLRAMESIFFEKKLITNDESIISQPFYSKDNIFIIGKDNLTDLKRFVEEPYKKLDPKLKKYYDVCEWLKRFTLDKYEGVI
ncbi:hypothetical protein [Sphingobacterium sp. 1.A.5]|uniref:hypothetical protein n=1 Tax=Sphingobacterium sp. 1.A.5 TaxID=2044604 RepID=UPI000C0BF78E|nr:hypothetical protein [Sphingobacterium sp. 1.A.5]